MMTKAFLHLLALIALLAPAVAQAESIASMNNPDRDYTIEGDVITVWTDSFLMNDGSGQLIIDVRPYTTRELRIAGRHYLQVTGRANEEGIMRPLVLSRANAIPVMFQGTAILEPLPLNDVMKNTVRYRLPRRAAAAANTYVNNAPNTPAATTPDYTSSGASPAAAVTPATSGIVVPANQ